MILLDVKNLKKVYTTRFKASQVVALNDITFSVESGDYVAIMGESGSGKTTLLNILATLDHPTSGSILLSGNNLGKIKDRDLTTFRRENLGFVFQDFNLLDTFSIRDNILLPLVLANKPLQEMNDRLVPIVEKLGIKQLLDKFPYEVSGGEKQRTAVARALINKPQLLLADEPTGALDSKATDQLLDLFTAINNEGQTVLMVTHSTSAASHAKRVLFIKDGVIFHQLYRDEQSNQEMYQRISETLTLLAQEVR
ncbi:ABC transporter ATP-binding protein YxdL [bioreactor metagenome]|uniref:ABC transporter ATP-binding protein YxdL n=1 Tax=bioreactor metagenome TaxID=1076179 RepID=A0A645A301_9ZZZZ